MTPSDTATPSIDPCRCPLCGQPNGCAMAAGEGEREGDGGTPCWCVNATFSPALLARVPVAAQRMACICARCAREDANA